MATPTRSHVALTPKNQINTTPSRSNASPRTVLGAFKTIAGKSPAIKTPASMYGHAHKMSISSHPTSTPLATLTMPDDIMNLNTPAALLTSLGSTGLTPLPSVVDGLGITTGTSDLPSTQENFAHKHPDRERHERLKEVAGILKPRTAGRGITREHIEKLASINRFDTGFDDGLLSIAGQRWIDLEITFDQTMRDTVKKVSLKLNLPEQDDAIYQEDASRVLTENLTLPQLDHGPWQDLTDFSANLAYLSRLEHIDTAANCFQVIDTLYDTFQRIWTEEKKRMKWRHDQHHLCQSNAGKPYKDSHGRLGVSTNFWTRGQHFSAKKEPESAGNKASHADGWNASFSIESGLPVMSESHDWLDEDALVSTARAEDIFQESAIDKPSWQTLSAGTEENGQENSSMDFDGPALQSKGSVNMHFTCDLQPPIYLPLQVAQALNAPSQMVNLHQDKLLTLQQIFSPGAGASEIGWTRWSQTQYVPGNGDALEEKEFSYIVYTNGQNWMHPINKLSFSHPRQFTEVLPVLRQYALVNTLMQSIKPLHGKPNGTTENPAPALQKGMTKPIAIRGKIVKRSNKPQLQADLKSLLKPSTDGTKSAIMVDITVDLTTSPTKSCRVELRIPVNKQMVPAALMVNGKPQHFIVIRIDIMLNGGVEVVGIDGVVIDKPRFDILKRRLARVVRTSEDLGIITAWTLGQLHDL